ncbi:MAG: thiamine-phosphate kinase [Deltaproteobacteria bacterium]|jgi:thiamine-monophosphate kinase|nr:thiamine-phosphate kinase [Deltaproteobacteria bacterium]
MSSESKFPGEFELISLLTRGEKGLAKDLIKGVGDDCAVIAKDDRNDLLISTDSLIEDVHFKRGWGNFETLGRKALTVNLSDIAAMGGCPLFYLVDIGIPPGMDIGDLSSFYEGMRQVAGRAGVSLVGGDTTASKDLLYLSITVIGEVPRGRALMRSGARPGDAIYVTGRLGGASLGLHCLMNGMEDDIHQPFIERQLEPDHRIAMGITFMETGFISSMIDISDGLVADMGHIADESGVGFTIESTSIPLFPNLTQVSSNLGVDPLRCALGGGEEYELLFTVDSKGEGGFLRSTESISSNVPITKIGVVEGDGAMRKVLGGNGESLIIDSSGFDHFGEKAMRRG